ncbi:aspartic peptidase A1 [Dichomitus squalens]|nr:aspartic peptidase A1 [Dichomitus squalens]TBU63006.1 aspartic peptidase A1 [Dichomitus squalens]
MSRGFFSFLLFALTFVVATNATSVVQVRDSLVRVPMVKRFNLTGSGTLLARDQARVKNLRARANARLSGTPLSLDAVISVPADNQRIDYAIDVQVGTPPTTYSLLVDTGSSNTWVGAGQSFEQTSTTDETGDDVSVIYGSGCFSGAEYTDTVSLGSGLTIPGQSIGVATSAEGFDDIDGILGIGPVDLTIGTLHPNTNTTIPTVTDNLFAQGTITSDLVAVSFEPTASDPIQNGELTFGGTDSSKFIGDIEYVPITTTFPSSDYFGIDQSIRYGTSTSILSTTTGIVDTGTTLILIADDAFSEYQSATGAVDDDETGLLRLTQAQFAKLQSLFFTIGGVTFELTPNAQIVPRALNSAIGGNADSVYLIVHSLGTPSGQGLDFINGQAFLERFYTVFDTGNNRVGIANTPFTNATTN